MLRGLPHLSDLSLRGCQHLTDAAAPAVARLRALTRLDLRCCERFTGAPLAPAGAFAARRLRRAPEGAGALVHPVRCSAAATCRWA